MARETKKSETSKQTRKRYSNEYKTEALALAERVGIAAAAEQLGLQASQLYSWRSQAQLLKRKGQVNSELATENVRLKRQLAEKEQEVAILKKASAYFARNLT